MSVHRISLHDLPSHSSFNYEETHNAEKDVSKTDSTPTSLLIPRLRGYAAAAAVRVSRGKTWLATWWQEAVAAVLLSAAAVASFATLYPYQGQPLPDWPYSITVATLLSIYSVVLRLAASFLLAEGLAQLKWCWFVTTGSMPLRDLVLYDDATRGPIGSIQLLWRLRDPMTWQWMGCGLAIIVLLTGPFTQQVLRYEQCPVLADAAERNASIARASVYFSRGQHHGPFYSSLSIAEQASLNAGIYTPGLMEAQCSTGNCTFAPYTSVGYCGSCNDISASMQFVVANPDSPDHSFEDIISYIPGYLNVTYSVNNKGTLVTGDSVAYNETKSFMIVIGPPNTKDGTNVLGPHVDCAGNTTWACRGAAAATCTLSPCVRAYQSSVTNGVFEETVTETWKDVFTAGHWSDGSLVWSAINKSCLTTVQTAALRKLNSIVDGDGPWVGYRGPDEYNSQNGSFDLAQMEQDLLNRQCLYAVDVRFVNGVGDYTRSGAFGGDVTSEWYEIGITTYVGPQLLLTIYNFGDISFERTQSVFENISLSLTNHMRLDPGRWDKFHYGAQDSRFEDGFDLVASQMPAQGQAFTMKTCLQIQWAWLALPAAMAILTLVFFVGVLISLGCLTRDVQTWKSSPLPLLFYGPLLGNTATFTPSQHISDLDEVAKGIKVSLQKDINGNMNLL